MPYIYRYVDANTLEIKYVGIIRKDSNFPNRFNQHKGDWWYAQGEWLIQYHRFPSIADVEILEGYFINKYRAEFNKAKSNWGVCSLAIGNINWQTYNEKTIELENKIHTLKNEVTSLKRAKGLRKRVNRDNDRVIDDFLKEMTEREKGAKVKRGDLYDAFIKWCGDIEQPHYIGKTTFFKGVERIGIPALRDRTGVHFRGLKLLNV